MNEFKIIQAINGADKDGYGKCTISIQPQRCDNDGNVHNTDEEYITEKPIVHLFRQAGGYVLLDLVFDSVKDVDLHRIYGYLQDFFKASNSATDDEYNFPLLLLTIVPEALNGEYFVIGVNPIFYALTPDNAKGEPKIIRLVFIMQDDPDSVPNFLFLKSNKDDLEEILAGEDEQ